MYISYIIEPFDSNDTSFILWAYIKLHEPQFSLVNQKFAIDFSWDLSRRQSFPAPYEKLELLKTKSKEKI